MESFELIRDTKSLNSIPDPYYRLLYPDLYDPAKGSATAGDISNYHKLLASGIPATSYAIAANRLTKLDDYGDDRSQNMQDNLKNSAADWPELDADHPDDWAHSDFKDISIQYVFPLYNRMIELGELNNN